MATPLREYIAQAIGNVGKTLKIGTFRQDAFLRSRGDRAAEFAPEHGPDGVSGNCDGREYRWEAMIKCVKNVHCGQDFWGYVYTPGETPDLKGPECFDYSELDILIFEGTYSAGSELFPYMHAALYLSAEPNLIRFNRLERGFVREGREWGRIQRMADVAESQYPYHLHPTAKGFSISLSWLPIHRFQKWMSLSRITGRKFKGRSGLYIRHLVT